MDVASVMDIGRNALFVVVVASPMLGLGLLVGLIVGILAATSVNEMTLTFVPKLFAVGLGIAFFGPWMINSNEFAFGMFNRIPGIFFEKIMISFLVADIVEIFYTVLLPFIRISAMLIVAPVLSMDSVTVKIRIIIAIALTIAIYPVLDWPVIDPVSGNGLVEITKHYLELSWGCSCK